MQNNSPPKLKRSSSFLELSKNDLLDKKKFKIIHNNKHLGSQLGGNSILFTPREESKTRSERKINSFIFTEIPKKTRNFLMKKLRRKSCCCSECGSAGEKQRRFAILFPRSDIKNKNSFVKTEEAANLHEHEEQVKSNDRLRVMSTSSKKKG